VSAAWLCMIILVTKTDAFYVHVKKIVIIKQMLALENVMEQTRK
jgi:hypothetical protein